MDGASLDVEAMDNGKGSVEKKNVL